MPFDVDRINDVAKIVKIPVGLPVAPGIIENFSSIILLFFFSGKLVQGKK